jgi:hypothetical protein
MRPGCEICERLWREYANATISHIRVTGKQRIEHLRGDREAEKILDIEVSTAAVARETARRAIKEHEAVSHDETADGEGRMPIE